MNTNFDQEEENISLLLLFLHLAILFIFVTSGKSLLLSILLTLLIITLLIIFGILCCLFKLKDVEATEELLKNHSNADENNIVGKRSNANVYDDACELSKNFFDMTGSDDATSL